MDEGIGRGGRAGPDPAPVAAIRHGPADGGPDRAAILESRVRRCRARAPRAGPASASGAKAPHSPSMDLPKALDGPSLHLPGRPVRRRPVARPAGPARTRGGRLTAVVTANAQGCTAAASSTKVAAPPELHGALFPGLGDPAYGSFSAHTQDLIGGAWPHCGASGGARPTDGADLVLVPATTALPAGATVNPSAHLPPFQTGQKLDGACARSSRWPFSTAGGQPGQIRRCAVVDPPVPGRWVAWCAWTCSTWVDSASATFDDQFTRTTTSRFPAASAACCRARVPRWTTAARDASATAGASCWTGDLTRSRISTGTWTAACRHRRHRVLPAAVLRRPRRRCSTTWAPRHAVCCGDLDDGLPAHFWRTRDRHRLDPGRPGPAVLCRPRRCSSAEQFFTLAKAHAQLALRPGALPAGRRPSTGTTGPPCPPHGGRAAPRPLALPRPHRRLARPVLVLAEAPAAANLLDFLRVPAGWTCPLRLAAGVPGQRQRVGHRAPLATGFATSAWAWTSSPRPAVRRRPRWRAPAQKNEQTSDVGR